MKVHKIIGKRGTGKTTKLIELIKEKCEQGDTIFIASPFRLKDKLSDVSNQNNVKFRRLFTKDCFIPYHCGGEYDYVFIDNETGTPSTTILEHIQSNIKINKAIYITETIQKDEEVTLLDASNIPRFYLRHKLADKFKTGKYMYLQVDEYGTYDCNEKTQTITVQSQFTMEEINEIPNDILQFFEKEEVPQHERADL